MSKSLIAPELRYNRGRCHDCDKWVYESRRAARHVVKTAHPGDRLDEYECPLGRGWHIGHPTRTGGGA